MWDLSGPWPILQHPLMLALPAVILCALIMLFVYGSDAWSRLRRRNRQQRLPLERRVL